MFNAKIHFLTKNPGTQKIDFPTPNISYDKEIFNGKNSYEKKRAFF